MIKRLQVKFVLAAMLALVLVVGVIMVTVNALNYHGIVANADGVLALLQQNDGRFPSPKALPGEGGPPAQEDAAWGNAPRDGQGFSPELPYESRYFTVELDADGGVLTVDTGRIAAIDTGDAVDYATAVYAGGRDAGFAGEYRYAVAQDGQGVRIVFLDCGRSLATFRLFLAASLGTSALGLAAVLVLLMLLSARVVRPVSDAYERQKRFITDAGHELKTPLTILDADAELLEMDLGPDNEWLADIRAQVRRLAGLTNDLIALARLQEGDQATPRLDLPLSDLAAEAARSFQAPARTGGKTLQADIAPGLWVCGEESALRKLVSILLDNAVKYAPEGSAIRLGLDRQGHFARLWVQNPAPGLAPAQLPRLFDRFYRADTARGEGGHGIGLALAQAIAGAHHGRIAADAPQPGTLRVTVWLPLAKPPAG